MLRLLFMKGDPLKTVFESSSLQGNSAVSLLRIDIIASYSSLPGSDSEMLAVNPSARSATEP